MLDNIRFTACDEELTETVESQFKNEDMKELAIKMREFALSVGYAQETVDKFIVNPYDGYSLLTFDQEQDFNLEKIVRKKVNKIRNKG